jgi:hypothetical protein
MSTNLTPKKPRLDDLACVYPNAAGLDIGSAEIGVAIPPERDPQSVRAFQTFTADLHALLAWLLACGIDTLALESTGVFWIPIYQLLEQAGITPICSMHAMSRRSLGARLIGTMRNGFRSCMRSASCRARFGPMPKSARCARWCAIALS